MKHTIRLPVFTLKQLQKHSKTFLKPNEEFAEDVSAALRCFEEDYENFGELGNLILIGIREKENNDYKMSVMVGPLDHYDKNVLVLPSPGYTKFKNLLINVNPDIVNTINRLQKITSFI